MAGITESKLRTLNGKPHGKAIIKMADRDGLSVYYRPSGVLSFVFRYRYNGKPQDLALGMYPVLTLVEARREAIECQRVLSLGQDPKLQKKLKKTKMLEAVTVKEAIVYWLDNYAAKNRSNHDKHRAQFEKHVFPYIGYLPLEQCETRHWVKVFDDITNGVYHRAAPKASGYILQNAKQALKFCRNRQYAHSTALDDLNISDIGEHQGKKDRVLSWSELKDVWLWTQDIASNWYYKNLIHLLIVFGCRTQELRLSKLSEWDLQEMIWTVPKSNSKTGNEIKRPIPGDIKPVIESLFSSSKNDYLLGELKRPETVSSFGSNLSKKLNHSPQWTLHDLRRTFATMLNDLQIEPYVVEQLLGHALGGVMAVYNRSQHIEKKRVALSVWLSKLNEIDSTSNVVGLR